MRAAFQEWLKTRSIKPSTQRTILSDARRIETHYKDLDEAYDADRFASIASTLSYSRSDELDGKPNPSKLPTSEGVRLSTLFPAYRSALKHYSDFRDTIAAGADAAGEHITNEVSDLTSALAKVTGEHAIALDWFKQHAGQTITWTKIKDHADLGARLVTQAKGIYKPHYTDSALSVRQTLEAHTQTRKLSDGQMEVGSIHTFKRTPTRKNGMPKPQTVV
jgi:hypothetical protein